MDVKNDIFWSEIGSGFGELGGTPPPRIPRSNSPPPPPPWLNRRGDTSGRDRFSSLANDKNSSLDQDYTEQK